jgi:predicted transcriptional regulator
MTKDQIAAILERVKTWPEDRQEDVVAVLLQMEAANDYEDDLTEEDWADLEEGLAEADRGELVSEEEMKVFFDKYR